MMQTVRLAAQVDKKVFQPAWGKNKKQAEQRAAANALAELAKKEIPYSDQPPLV
jgi:ribonuclease-3